MLSVQQESEQARSQIVGAQSAIAEIDSQIQEAQLNVQQSRGDTDGRVSQSRSQVATAKAQLAQAEAQAKQSEAQQKLAALNQERYVSLLKEGAINQQQFDQTEAALYTAQADYQAKLAGIEAARQQLSAFEGGLTQTESTGLNPTIRNAQLGALMRKREQSQALLNVAVSNLKATESRVKDAESARQQLLTQIKDSKSDLNVVSPLGGIVTARSVEPGYNDFVYSFEPPCLVKVEIEPKPGWRLIASDYFVPLTENRTRLFVFEARDWLTWNPLVSWQLRRKANQILDEDLPILKAQTDWHHNGYGDWNCTVKPDLLSLRYRQWYDRKLRQATAPLMSPTYEFEPHLLAEEELDQSTLTDVVTLGRRGE